MHTVHKMRLCVCVCVCRSHECSVQIFIFIHRNGSETYKNLTKQTKQKYM